MAVLCTGCLETSVPRCEDGRLCPIGTTCFADGCVPTFQLEACDGKDDGDTCAFPGTAGHCDGGLCVPAGCGDGVVAGDEQCEGAEVGAHTCAEFGFHDPAGVACDAARCLLDASGCSGERCGDGVRNGAEACEAGELAGATCDDFGFHAGTLACTSVCTYDTSGCAELCGDGVVNGDEACDGEDVPLTCLDLGRDHGRLRCTAACDLDDALCGDLGWVQRSSGTAQSLSAIWGAAADDIFAVGYGGAIVHWDGATWSPMVSGTTEFLRDVWGTAADDVYAVGASGTFLHFDGAAWSAIDLGTPYSFRAVHGAAPDEVWAVGFAEVQHFDGTTWSTVDVGAAGGPSSVWVVAAGDVYVGTDFGEILHLTDGVWTEEPSGVTSEIVAIGSVAGEVHAVAYSGAVLRRDGGGWTIVHVGRTVGSDGELQAIDDHLLIAGTWGMVHGQADRWQQLDVTPANDLTGVWGASLDDVWAVGPAGGIYHFGGSGPTMTPFGPVAFELAGLHGSGPEDVYAVGDYGTILHLDAAGWSRAPTVTDGDLTRVFAAATDRVYVTPWSYAPLLRYDGNAWAVWEGSPVGRSTLWASGQDLFTANGSSVDHYDGTTWTDVSIPDQSVDELWGTAADDVYAGVTSGAARWDGTSWTVEDPGCACFSGNRTAWASAADDRYAAFNGKIYHRDGSGWSLALTTSYVNALWGSAPDDVFAATSQAILHFDGVTWTTQFANAPSPSWIWGTGPDDVYALGYQVIWHFDGTAWSSLFDPDAREDALAIAPSGEALAVGPGGSIVRRDGDGWWPMTSPTTADLHAVWTDGATAVAVGDAGTVLRFDGTRWTVDAAVTSVALRGVWGDDAVGDGGVRLHYDGAAWNVAASTTTNDLRAIAGAFEVGEAGTILVGGVAAASPTSEDLTAVWASGANDVYAVGAAGVVVHHDGATWTVVDTGLTEDLVGVTGTSATDVLVVAASGATVRFDGVGWSPVRFDAGPARGVVAGPDAIYVLGDAAPACHARLASW